MGSAGYLVWQATGLSGCKCKYAYEGAANQTYVRLVPKSCAAVVFAMQWTSGQPTSATQFLNI
eukprot:8894760-Lingulodinium_polyedra.AAC.1